MRYFLDTTETVPGGVGFSHLDRLHLIWLFIFLAVTVFSCIWYRKMGERGRRCWKKTVAVLLLADELFKVIMLVIGGRYLLDYLPLHLCSINIFMITFHAWKPNKTIGGYLYMVGIPGALAALLFPSWTSLPLGNFILLPQVDFQPNSVSGSNLATSVLNGLESGFFHPNHAASTRLFCLLHIHDGVNTSARLTERCRCSSAFLSTRGRITGWSLSAICATCISSFAPKPLPRAT